MLVAGPIKSAVLIEKVSQLGPLLGQGGAEVAGAKAACGRGCSPGVRRMAGGQSPPPLGGPGREEYWPGWTRSCHSSALALPPSDPAIQASLPTTHFYTSLHAALPVPEAWLAPGIHQASRGQGHVFSPRSPLTSGMLLPTLSPFWLTLPNGVLQVEL